MRLENPENLLHPGQVDSGRDQKLSPIRRHRQQKMLNKVMAALGATEETDIDALVHDLDLPAGKDRLEILLMLGMVMREQRRSGAEQPELAALSDEALVAQLQAISAAVADSAPEITNFQAFTRMMLPFPAPSTLPTALSIQYAQPDPDLLPAYERWASRESDSDRATLVLISAYLQCCDPIRALEMLTDTPKGTSLRAFYEFYFTLAQLQLGDRGLAKSNAKKIKFFVHEDFSPAEGKLLTKMRSNTNWLQALPEMC